MPSPARSSDSIYAKATAMTEVPMLVEQAEKMKKLGPILENVSTKQREPLLKTISRQVQLIKSRSQTLEDGHVTVYDKALLILTRNGRDPEYPPAIHFYCEHYLGIDRTGGHTEMEELVRQCAETPGLIEEGEGDPRPQLYPN